MSNLIAAEILELHYWFEAWFLGRLDQISLSRVDQCLSDDFHLVNPSGVLATKPELLETLVKTYGTYQERDFAIVVKNIQVRPLSENVAIARYEEWHKQDGNEKGRLSLAVFKTEPELVWEHVHEVWLPES
ncbi:MAG: DUF4440 domain-containing protein [Candidatus Eisenbacteria bacterium]|uniref:DUF4440 domain-containing protein n=1 Tax=Eiseniibacteriota bacterium TaxID=2212470 RepID=A0A7Y2H2D8_UNCEI|nr:DUF4440 domain-containing protein [Candidatus Eisenbacteria bacterium]